MTTCPDQASRAVVTTSGAQASWWRAAAIYQVYVRSFSDGNGDGTGDLAGVRDKIPYLARLGVDAIWLNPWYPSPMADAGYDVADYRDIDPVFGTLAEAEKLIDELHDSAIRVIIDIVPNHCSNEHRWFKQALAAGPGSPARELFWFRKGRGEHGELPPNDWDSIFGGPAWTRVTEPDGEPGEWYLHLFAPEQPDFNWDNPLVRKEFEDVLRFWFDRGVDGIRIDSAALLLKDPQLRDLELATTEEEHPFTDRSAVHDVYRSWRKIAESYAGERILIGEVWLPDRERFTRYLRPDELHTAFNFEFLGSAWNANEIRRVVDSTIADHAPIGAPPTWVLSNHDVVRHVTRYGRADTSFSMEDRRLGSPVDIELGTTRARAATLLTMALPGAVYLYQGEELGLWEVEDLPIEVLQDPMYRRSGGTNKGRDGCRVPLPWSGSQPPFGFNDRETLPWLPQPPSWESLTAEREQADPNSMLSLYEAALRLRRAWRDRLSDTLTWLPTPAGVLAFTRGAGFACVVNISDAAVELPPHRFVVLTSVPLVAGRLPVDATAWLDLGAADSRSR